MSGEVPFTSLTLNRKDGRNLAAIETVEDQVGTEVCVSKVERSANFVRL